MKKSQPQRRKFYINPLMQGRIISRLSMYWCVYHLVLWHAMFLYRYLEYRDAVIKGAPRIPLGDLYWGFAFQNSTMIICAAMVFPLILWDMIYFSHRIAGPLVRFQNSLRRLADGERVPKIELRHGDLLDDLRDAFNDYLDALESRRAEQQVAEMIQPRPVPASIGAAGASAASSPNVPEEFATILHDLRDIQSSVGRVKTDEPAPAGRGERTSEGPLGS